MPGSSKRPDERTGTTSGMFGRSSGVLARTARRMRRHARSRGTTTTMNPHAHTATTVGATQCTGAPGAFVGIVDRYEKGWATCSTMAETTGVTGTVTLAAGAHANRLPRLTSAENGTTNFSEAANQSEYQKV